MHMVGRQHISVHGRAAGVQRFTEAGQECVEVFSSEEAGFAVAAAKDYMQRIVG